MRIALISYEFPPETLGGIATYARHTVETLIGAGHEVTVFTATTAAPHAEDWHGAHIRRLPCADRGVFAEVAVPALAAEHARAPFDVAEVPDLYAEGRGLRAKVPALPLVLRAHTPLYIPSEIDFLALPPFTRRLSAFRRLLGGIAHRQPWRKTWSEASARVRYRYDPRTDPECRVAHEADLVAAPSQRLAQRLRLDWSLPAERIVVLPYAHSPAPELLALAAPAQARTIAFHGSVRFFKGVHVLMAAMRIVVARHPQVQLALAGASGSSPVATCGWQAWRADRMLEWRDTLEWLRPQIAALGNHVIVRGFVPPEKLATHLAAAEVCVFPSLFDNFPSACLEAMSAARPIVATRSGGMEEMLGEEDAGLLVPPGNAPALAAAICRLIEDPALRTRLALRARAKVLSDYAPAVIGPRHEALYAQAIALRRATR
jgi:glycosyltransferase involved in cell wall biosynthesis